MNVVQAFTSRREGNRFSCNRDFAIPRLFSYETDTYTGMGIVNWEDEDLESLCLVGRFCPYESKGNLIALANEDGYVAIQDSNKTGQQSIVTSFRAHDNAIFGLTWMENHDGSLNIVTSSGDKKIKIWDAETCAWLYTLEGHSRSPRTVHAHPSIPGLLVSGGRDGRILVIDRRCGNPNIVNTIVGAHIKGGKVSSQLYSNQQSVTSLVFQDEHTLISAGFSDGMVKVWDLRRTYNEKPLRQAAPLHCLPVDNTVTSLSLSNNLLYASCLSYSIFCFDVNSYNKNPVNIFVGHQTSSMYVEASLSSCGNYLMCGSSDNEIYIWSTDLSRSEIVDEPDIAYPCVKPIAKLSGHFDEVSCVQCAPTSQEFRVLSISDDMTHRIWRIGPSLEYGEGILCEDKDQGIATILSHKFFKHEFTPRHTAERNMGSPKKGNVSIFRSDLPNYVHNPSSLCHKCPTRPPKKHTNWLTELGQMVQTSPQRTSPSVGKVKKTRRPSKTQSKKLLIDHSTKSSLLNRLVKSSSKPKIKKSNELQTS